MSNNENAGGASFVAMVIILIVMVVCCMILPLAVQGFSAQPWAVPLMAVALVLPFLHFFIFGAALRKK